MILTEKLLDPTLRPRVVDALVEAVDAEMREKSGLGGLVLKGAYATAKGASPQVVRSSVDAMLPDVLTALQPTWDSKGQRSLGEAMAADSSRVADAVLAVADAKAERVDNPALVRVYRSVRGKAKENVVAALPRLGAALESFLR